MIPVGDKWPEHEGFYLDLVKEGDTISILQANENGEYCGEYNCTESISEFKEFINKINNSGKAALELLISIFKDMPSDVTEDDYKRILRPENSVRKVDINGRTVYRDGVWFLK